MNGNVFDDMADKAIMDLFSAIGDQKSYWTEMCTARTSEYVAPRFSSGVNAGHTIGAGDGQMPRLPDVVYPIEGPVDHERKAVRYFVHDLEGTPETCMPILMNVDGDGWKRPAFHEPFTIDPTAIKDEARFVVPGPDSPDPGKDRAGWDFFKVWRDNPDVWDKQ